MRLLLDAHVSGRRVAARLRDSGHDVRAADEERALDGMTDEDLLSFATSEGRILVTFNAGDFAEIARRWGEAGKRHAGLALVVGVDHSEFGVILRVLAATLDRRPRHDDWVDFTCFVTRGG